MKSTRTTRHLLAVAVAITAAVTVAAPAVAETTEAAPSYREYVALGDSWTADVVLLGVASQPTAEHVPIDCFQSNRNYPKQVAQALGVAKFRDASCGSATTEHFTEPQSGLPFGGTNAPQFDRLTRTTDLVTVGIGGNDAGLAGAIVSCINLLPSITVLPGLDLPAPLGGSCEKAYTANGSDRMSEQIKAAEPKLVAALKGVHKRAPKADVFLVNYLAGARGPGCWPYIPMLNEDYQWVGAKLRELNAMLARAAQAARARLVDTYQPTIGHDVCQWPTDRYAEAVLPISLNGPAVAVPFHPNSAGANAQAQIVLKAIRGQR